MKAHKHQRTASARELAPNLHFVFSYLLCMITPKFISMQIAKGKCMKMKAQHARRFYSDETGVC